MSTDPLWLPYLEKGCSMTYPKELTTEQKEAIENQTSEPPDWDGVYLMSPFSGIGFNCMGWALGEAELISIPSKAESCLYLINKNSPDTTYELVTDGDYSRAKYLLFGNSTNEVEHITVLMSYDELRARTRTFQFLEEVDYDLMEDFEIPNPFWSSALGFGYGVTTNPMDWFVGGVYDQIVAGVQPVG